MDGSQFDNLSRLVGSRLTRRAGIALLATAGLASIDVTVEAKRKKGKGKGKGKKKVQRITVCHDEQTIQTSARGWPQRYPEGHPGACAGECDGCAAGRCFASAVDANSPTREPLGFACCPAEKVCTHPAHDAQCCYPDETCMPALGDNPDFDTICCRPCNGACCPRQNDECIEGECQLVNTARLPRNRRP